tara:strand:- start:445 stop:1176 length:732 start_codon:yes stop_codon:yes gene_type:complete
MHTQKIKNNVIVDESMMKAYLLDYWRSSGYISSSTLVINELTFVGLSRRIDLALVKDGELIGIEIKSELDTLKRLDGQLEEYAAYFDKIYVFTTEKHYERSSEIATRSEGILVLKNNSIKTMRRGRKQPIRDRRSFIKMMRATDLYHLVRKSGVKPSSMERKSLENFASKLPLYSLREAAIEQLKKRFTKHSDRFWANVESNIYPLDITELKKSECKKLTASRDDSVSSMIKNGNFHKILNTQ